MRLSNVAKEPMNTSDIFTERFTVRWSDVDANRHARNTLYSDLATHTRFRLLEACGFPESAFEAQRFGPVMFREEIRYRRELRLGEGAVVDVRFAGLSEDGSRWRVHQEVRRADGEQAASLSIDGAWIDLDTRTLVSPPAQLLDILRGLPRTNDFSKLRSILRAIGRTPS